MARALQGELDRQREWLEMIPSENFVSPAVLEALGSVATNKYAEGYPDRRYYGGCHFIDQIEQLAIDRAKKLFGAEHANVQLLSGAPANNVVYSALLQPGDTVLGMDLSHGGHLTHGHPVTQAAKLYNFIRYKTREDGLLDLDQIRALAHKHKPKIILVGFSAYSREIDYTSVDKIAKEVGAITMADIAHVAGLIAGGALQNPVPLFDVVTTTTHKTLRGPRGGMILCKEKFAKTIDKAVFPGLQGGPHMNNIAAMAIALKEASGSSFRQYAKQVLKNAKVLEVELAKLGHHLCFGGTDNHLLLLDVTPLGLSGKQAEVALDLAGITVNKNMIPNDQCSPMDPSGIRLGTPALTTRGMKEKEMRQIAVWIDSALHRVNDAKALKHIKRQVSALTTTFPLYQDIRYT